MRLVRHIFRQRWQRQHQHEHPRRGDRGQPEDHHDRRSDGSVQATFDGHPLYTFAGDTAAGQAKGNGLNAAGGLWHEITTSGSAAPVSTSAPGGGGNGY